MPVLFTAVHNEKHINTHNEMYMRKTIHCFFSGGRDSALACYIAKRVANVRSWEFRLVHIDTTVYIKETREYVYKYAQRLGVETIVIKPERTFREYAERYGMWPSLFPYRYRWCMRDLKLKPTVRCLRHTRQRKQVQGKAVQTSIRRPRLWRQGEGEAVDAAVAHG